MWTKRSFITAATLTGAAMLLPVAAQAADWQTKYKTISYGVVTSENEADRIVRYKPVVAYLERKLGVDIEFRNATDYAGIIEGVKAGKIQLAGFGPAAYAQAWIVTNGGVEPLVGQLDKNGDFGYFAVVVVRADSPHKEIGDLKGKKFAFADPNSTSGYQAPRYFLSEQGYEPEAFFGETAFSGSHENSVIALLNGTFDGAATWYNNDERSNFTRMMGKGMIPKDSIRVIWKSPLLPSSPVAVPSNLPEDMKRDIKAALLAMPTDDPDAWKALTDGKAQKYVEVTHDQYDPIVRMIRHNLRARRGS